MSSVAIKCSQPVCPYYFFPKMLAHKRQTKGSTLRADVKGRHQGDAGATKKRYWRCDLLARVNETLILWKVSLMTYHRPRAPRLGQPTNAQTLLILFSSEASGKTLRQPFRNPLPTLRQPFANLVCQPLSKPLFPWAPITR